MKISRFIQYLILITAVLAAIAFFATMGAWDAKVRGFLALAVCLASFATAISYIITYNGMEKNIRMFSTFLIGGMVFKMFFAMICLTIISLTMREIAVRFVLTYFFSYIIFISFEVFALMTKLRPFSKESEQHSNENSGK